MLDARRAFCYTIRTFYTISQRHHGAYIRRRAPDEARWSDEVMSTLRHMPRYLPSIHTTFYAYRWAAWLVACGATFWLAPSLPDTPRLVGLLALTGVLNIAATALAQAYVQLVQRRPWLLLLDILLGVSLIWSSGGGTLPFLPYALGALLVPAALGGWRGSIWTGLGFIFLDQAVRLLGNIELALPELLVRLLLPLIFAHTCAALALLARQSRAMSGAVAAPSAAQRSSGQGGQRLSRSPRGALSLLDSQNPRSLQSISASASASLAALRLTRSTRSDASQAAAPQREPQHSRSGVARPPAPAAPPDLTIVLQQLVDEHNRLDRPMVHLVLEGSGHVSYARYLTLVKLAYEALQNVYQHAHAHAATVTLTYKPGFVELMVRDDGVGLLDGTYERPGLHALRALHYRLAEMDGRLDVFEPRDGGLVVRGVLPLES
jgi:hypothetical protein